MKVQAIAFLWLGKREGPKDTALIGLLLRSRPSHRYLSNLMFKAACWGFLDGKIREEHLLKVPGQVSGAGCEPRSIWTTKPWFHHTFWYYLFEQLCSPSPLHMDQRVLLLIRHFSLCCTLSWTSCPWNLSQSPNLKVQGCNCRCRFYLQSPLESSSLAF